MLERLNEALSERYRIESELGEGGMATVYLAHDLKHDRRVAVKVLKPALAAVIGADRFVAEIRTTASLQHPHILPLFDSGQADSFLYYVMPYVEGESLRDRLDREAQLSVDEALAITRDVADALDYAHRQGVIHRDIKPENILLHEGRPVVADFGIAVAISAAGGGRMTETGLSLGTPHYMSPEQATADRDLTVRSDVYSVACVLYEMLAGDPPHTGPTAQAILVRILTETPRPVSDTRASVPPHVAAVLAKALEKLPADRFESAADFKDALERTDFTYRPVRRTTMDREAEPIGATTGAGGAVEAPGRRARRLMPWGVAGVAGLLAAFGWLRPAADADHPARLDLTLGDVTVPEGQQVVVSPDGSMLGVAGQRDGEEAIFVRGIDEAEWRAVPGTKGGQYPIFSPDAEWIVFQSDDNSRLVRVSTTGAGALTLAEESGVDPYDPHWGRDGTIVFTGPQGLHRVSEAGGEVRLLSPELAGRNPHMLPDGSGVLATTFGAGIHYYDLEADSSWLLIPDAAHPWYVDTGHILFVPGGGGLFAVPFDLKTATLTGDPRRVLDRVGSTNTRRGFALAEDGTLVHLMGEGSGSTGGEARFLLFDRSGNADTLGLRPAAVFNPRLSPDGRRLAYAQSEGSEAHIHTFDLLTGEPQQVTFEGTNISPVWSPEGGRIAFASNRSGTDGFDVFVKPSDNSSPESVIVTGPGNASPTAWPADTLLALATWGGGEDLLLLRLPSGAAADSVRTRPFLQAEWSESHLAISPDMTLAALESSEAGDDDVWVRTFPDPVGQWRVSTGGGDAPRWSPDGRTLYFWKGAEVDTLVAVTVEREPSVRITDRRAVLAVDVAGLTNWDLHPDGERFLVTVDASATGRRAGEVDGGGVEDRYLVVLDWLVEMRATLDGR